MNDALIQSRTFPEYDPSQKENWEMYAGYICSTCRLIWLGDYTIDDLDEDDYNTAAAERFMAGARELHVHGDAESGLNTTCLICDIGIIINGYAALLLADPAGRAAKQAQLDAEADEPSDGSEN